MSYSNPITTMIVNPVEQDFGAGTGTAWSFKGPTGKKGILIDVGLFVTETFVDDTAPTAGVAIGTSGDADAYALLEVADGTALTDTCIEVTETFACDSLEACFNVGTSSDADAYCKLNITDGTAITDTFNIQNDTNAIIAEAIPADTQIECLPVAGTDGSSVTGQGYTYVVVEWY